GPVTARPVFLDDAPGPQKNRMSFSIVHIRHFHDQRLRRRQPQLPPPIRSVMMLRLLYPVRYKPNPLTRDTQFMREKFHARVRIGNKSAGKPDREAFIGGKPFHSTM